MTTQYPRQRASRATPRAPAGSSPGDRPDTAAVGATPHPATPPARPVDHSTYRQLADARAAKARERLLQAHAEREERINARRAETGLPPLSIISRLPEQAPAAAAETPGTSLVTGHQVVLGAGDGNEGFPRSGDPEFDALELMRRVEASDLGGATLEGLFLVVDGLCRDYPNVPARGLCDRTEGYLRHIMRLLDGRTTLAQHQELLVDAGWLAALLSCLHYDLGEGGSAELYRRMARQLGEQAGHGEMVSWSWEIAAWFALVGGRYDDAISLSEAALGHAGATSAAVQLSLQAGRAYARMGDDKRARSMLETGRRVLGRLPAPEHPEHHFVFDGAKYEFYVATILTWLKSDDIAAEEHAREVVAQCRDKHGRILWPTRLGTTQLNLGLIATRRTDLEEAVAHGKAALRLKRRSAEFLPRALELHAELEAKYPKERRTSELREMLALDAGAQLYR
jgi:tetratricopeptide (TPR) repeat protein